MIKNSVFYITHLFFILLILTGCDRETSTSPATDDIPPSAPKGMYVYAARDGFISFEWNRNPEPDIVSYNIYRGEGTDSLSFYAETENYYYVDVSLDYEITYYYSITAVDRDGYESSRSSVVSSKPENRYAPGIVRYPEAHSFYDENKGVIELTWQRPDAYDLDGFRIYRSTSENFTPDSAGHFVFTPSVGYTDTTADMLTEYYYRISAVDKGGLEGKYSAEVSDMVIDAPEIIFPAEGDSVTGELPFFSFRSSGAPARYMAVIHSNPVYNPVQEVEIGITAPDSEVTFRVDTYYLEYYKKYYWQVLVYTGSGYENPNAASSRDSFIIIPPAPL